MSGRRSPRRSAGSRASRSAWRPDAGGPARRYPRAVRVNQVLREIVASELEVLAGADERLAMVTVTAVDCERDLRRATVYLSSLGDDARLALDDSRVRLQAAVGAQASLKFTPHLSFVADPAVASGRRIEEILRGLAARDDPSAGQGPPGGDGAGGGGAGGTA